MSRTRYKVGTRGSKLALAQTQRVIDLLHSFDPEAEFTIEIIHTAGDEGSPSLDDDPGQADLFTAELERGLLNEWIDIAVHAAKDLPTVPTTGLAVAAYPVRVDPREALVTLHGEAFFDLPTGCVMGISSLRRRYQLAELRRDFHFVSLRGNLDTRIHKVMHGDYQAAVVAQSGLILLGLADQASQVFPLDQVLPAAGQGALALQSRHDDLRSFQLLELANHEPTSLAVLTERSVVRCLQASDIGPVAVSASYPFGYMQRTRRWMRLEAVAFGPGGESRSRAEGSGPPAQWHDLALNVADQLRTMMGTQINRLAPSERVDRQGVQ